MSRFLLKTSYLLPVIFWVACAARSDTDPSATAVRINDEQVSYREFADHMESTFGEGLPPVDDSETLSRLLDQFIEERLLLQEARKKGIRVDDAAVDRQLKRLGLMAKPGQKVDAALREKIRSNLIVAAFEEEELLRDVRVPPQVVENYYKQHPEEFGKARGVVLRQVLVDEKKEAEAIRSLLQERPEEFVVLAERYSVAPDRGQLQSYREDELPEQIREAVFSLDPGQTTPILEEGGRYRILRVVEREDIERRGLEEVRAKIELLLLQRAKVKKLGEAVANLIKSSRIEIQVENIPFRYVGDSRE